MERGRGWGEHWQVGAVALLTAAMGVINMLSAITPSMATRIAFLEEFLPLGVRRGGRLAAALSAFALLTLAQYLWRRKRVAWWITLVVLMISAASHLVKGLDYEEALLSAGLAAWLLALRHHFHARSDLPSIRQGLTALAWAGIFTLIYGVAGFYLLDRNYSVNFGLLAALKQTVVMFTQFYDPGLEPVTGFGRYFAASIYFVGAITFGYAFWMLARPVLIRRPATAAEREHARQIVEMHGCSPLARFALFEDKSYYFSGGGSLIAFAQKGRAAVALGDPIGPGSDLQAAIRGFLDYCAENDWVPAFYHTIPDTVRKYQDAGLEALCIGNEAIVDLRSFTLEGKASKPLRAPVNRFTREGYLAKVYAPPIPDNLLHELREVSDEWLTMMHGSEKRFSLGWFDDDYIRSSPVMVLHTSSGPVSAFANIVPGYQSNMASVDLMRHRKNAEPGTMDFLFVSLLLWAKEQGDTAFDLGLSALSGVGEQRDDPAAERALHFIYEHIDQYYNFKGLHEFKEKFHPAWSPRYLVYPGPASLPSVAFALAMADSGGRLFRR